MKRLIIVMLTVTCVNVIVFGQWDNYVHEYRDTHFQNDTTFYRNFISSVGFLSTRFEGRTAFDDIYFKQVAAFQGVQFNGIVSFNTSLFDDEVIFDNTRFNSDIIFRLARFNKGVQFRESNFLNRVDFSQVEFNAYAIFYIDTFWNSCDFQSKNLNHCSFIHSKFCKDIYFNEVAIGQARFVNTVFDSLVSFKKTKFDTVYFENDTFRHSADFSYATFNNIANFSGCHFEKIANFSCLNLTEKSRLLFDRTSLPDTIDFSNNPICHNVINLMLIDSSDYVDADQIKTENLPDFCKLVYNTLVNGLKRYFLMYDNHKKVHYINLFNSDISKIKIDYIKFRLFFKDALSDSMVKISREKKLAMYQILLKDFENRGLSESYKNLDIEYQKFKGKSSFLGWKSWLPDWWWRFGYEKGRIFVHILLFLFGFTIITFFFLPFLNANVYKLEAIPAPAPFHIRKNFFSRIWFSFVYTSIVFFLFSLKVENIQFNRKLGTFYLMLVYTTGIICIGYLANFILQK